MTENPVGGWREADRALLAAGCAVYGESPRERACGEALRRALDTLDAVEAVVENPLGADLRSEIRRALAASDTPEGR